MANNDHFELTLDTLAPTGSISGLGEFEKENKPLVIDGAYLKCINHDCSGRLYGRIMSFIQSMSIDSFGPKLVDKLISAKIQKFAQRKNLR